jgi:hypothetical protein
MEFGLRHENSTIICGEYAMSIRQFKTALGDPNISDTLVDDIIAGITITIGKNKLRLTKVVIAGNKESSNARICFERNGHQQRFSINGKLHTEY